MVSAVPSSPDCTTKASRPAVKHSRNKGSRSHRPKREVIALHGNTGEQEFEGRALHGVTMNRRANNPTLRPEAVDCIGKNHVHVRVVRYGTEEWRARLLALWDRGQRGFLFPDRPRTGGP